MNKTSFNEGWRYTKQGDKQSIPISLPHDAMITEKRDPNAPNGAAGGYFPGGVYTYEKTFDVPEAWRDKHIFIVFEGVYQNAKVYLGDRQIGGCAYGYSPFTVNLDCLDYDTANTLRVVADNSRQPNSRWYSGSGIYRPVWLYVADKHHFIYEGIQITTLSVSPARIRVEAAHNAGEDADVEVCIAYNGRTVAAGRGECVELDIPDACLWSAETPTLYECHAKLILDGNTVDEHIEEFGIRKINWSTQGLFINGTETLLRGACVHHDNGILGARSYAESEDRRVRIIKQAGYNAIRISHNPASKAMLAACDRHGMYVIDETWDMWYSHKNKFDYAPDFIANYKYDIKALVRRDYNHPSVIMYSICNEVSEPKDEKGLNIAREIIEAFRSLDSTRAITGGVNLFVLYKAASGNPIYKEEGGRAETENQVPAMDSLMFNKIAIAIGTGMNNAANIDEADEATTPFLDMLDIAGYNYATGRYPLEAAKHPNRIIVGSETFPQDIAKNWGMVKEYPYLIGDFMWTGWDYLGEVGAFGWNYNGDTGFEKPYPWISADAGAIDLIGNIGAEAEYAATVWGLRDKPYIGVQPVNHQGQVITKSIWRGTNAVASWSWQGCDGNDAIIEVYSDAHEVKLFINGESIGRKPLEQFKAIFETQYKSGAIMVVAFDENGNEASRSGLVSANGKVGITVKPEKGIIRCGEVVYVNISLTGENDVVESNSDTSLTVSVTNGELLAFGSANPCTEESYNSGTFTTYYGRALAVVKAIGTGELKINAEGNALSQATALIQVI